MRNKRKHCGYVMPNIYAVLQVTALAVTLYLAMQIWDVLGGSEKLEFILVLVGVVYLSRIVESRSKVMRRQKEHCCEDRQR